jgi:hypothetical protein
LRRAIGTAKSLSNSRAGPSGRYVARKVVLLIARGQNPATLCLTAWFQEAASEAGPSRMLLHRAAVAIYCNEAGVLAKETSACALGSRTTMPLENDVSAFCHHRWRCHRQSNARMPGLTR